MGTLYIKMWSAQLLGLNTTKFKFKALKPQPIYISIYKLWMRHFSQWIVIGVINKLMQNIILDFFFYFLDLLGLKNNIYKGCFGFLFLFIQTIAVYSYQCSCQFQFCSSQTNGQQELSPVSPSCLEISGDSSSNRHCGSWKKSTTNTRRLFLFLFS